MTDEPEPRRARRLEVRSAARLILLDDARRVLLFLHTDRESRLFWATPGGGIDPGESAESAARREASEELGSWDVVLEPLWSGHTSFQFADRDVEQAETFFLIRSHSGILGPSVEETHRREGILESRWWTVGEIEQSREAIYPEDLAARLTAHFARAARPRTS